MQLWLRRLQGELAHLLGEHYAVLRITTKEILVSGPG
jgi:hypothetical protein